MKLFRTLILRPLLHDPLRTALTILAVALGVAAGTEIPFQLATSKSSTPLSRTVGTSGR